MATPNPYGIYAGGMQVAPADQAIIASMRGSTSPAVNPNTQQAANQVLNASPLERTPPATTVAPIPPATAAPTAAPAPAPAPAASTSTPATGPGPDGGRSPYGAAGGGSTYANPPAIPTGSTQSNAPAPATTGAATAPPPAPATTTTTGTTAAPAPTAPKPVVNVANLYRNTFGRDPEKGGLAFWQAAFDKSDDPQAVYNDMVKSGLANGETTRGGRTFQEANEYDGPTSNDGSMTIDDWGTNVLERQLTPAEAKKYDDMINANPTVEGTKAAYAQFLADFSGQVKNNMDVFTASQLKRGPASPLTVNGPATATGYDPSLLEDPERWEVTDEQTVQGQLKKVMDDNGPIIQQARTQALQQMEGRGLTNSSLAVTAGQDAAYRAATPIAGADAATYGKAAGYNADQKNQFSMKNADMSNQAKMFNADSINKWQMANLDANTRMNMQYVDSKTRVDLANIEANYKMLIQSNTAAGDEFRQISANITNISMSKDMDAMGKDKAIQNQLGLLKTAMGINGAISNLDLQSLLDFSDIESVTTPGYNQYGPLGPNGVYGASGNR